MDKDELENQHYASYIQSYTKNINPILDFDDLKQQK
jgi:hypothetical protein